MSRRTEGDTAWACLAVVWVAACGGGGGGSDGDREPAREIPVVLTDLVYPDLAGDAGPGDSPEVMAVDQDAGERDTGGEPAADRGDSGAQGDLGDAIEDAPEGPDAWDAPDTQEDADSGVPRDSGEAMDDHATPPEDVGIGDPGGPEAGTDDPGDEPSVRKDGDDRLGFVDFVVESTDLLQGRRPVRQDLANPIADLVHVGDEDPVGSLGRTEGDPQVAQAVRLGAGPRRETLPDRVGDRALVARQAVDFRQDPQEGLDRESVRRRDRRSDDGREGDFRRGFRASRRQGIEQSE